MNTILRPGADDDAEIKRRLELLVGALPNPLRVILNEYYEKINAYDVQAPFPVLSRGITAIQQDQFHMFSYRNKIFHGKVTGNTNGKVSFLSTSLQQVMADGSLARKRFDGTTDRDINTDDAWKDVHPHYPDGFWGAIPFYGQVPLNAIVYERRFYSILKPFYQFIGLVREYENERVRGNVVRQTEIKTKLRGLLYDSLTKVDFSGKLPKAIVRDASVPRPSDVTIRRKNKDKVVISWTAVHTYNWHVSIGRGANGNVQWEKVEEVKGNSIVRDRKNNNRIHVVVAFKSYNSDSNQMPLAPPSNPTPNIRDLDPKWSYASYDTPEFPKFTMVQLFDIDKFRLEIDAKYDTIYDLIELLGRPDTETLVDALRALNNMRITLIVNEKKEVTWEPHLKIPFLGSGPYRSWNEFTYIEKVFTICRDALESLDGYVQHMEYYGAPSVVLNPDEYTRPVRQGGINLLTSSTGQRLEQQDFHIEDKAIEVSKSRYYYARRPGQAKNILLQPWRKTKQFFKVYDRKRGTAEYADFIYLSNGQEKEACKRLRRIKRSLDHSDHVGFPVIENEIAAPYNYQSNVHAARVTTFGPNNYNRTQAFPSLARLPRVMTLEPNEGLTPQVDYFDTSGAFDGNQYQQGAFGFDVAAMRPAKRIRVRENANGELPHPIYPGRLKVESKTRIGAGYPANAVTTDVLTREAALMPKTDSDIIIMKL
ncbi:MAG: hypothetical protein CMH46_00115 [Muricauda sp.]|nr:hypothetical protein [Allomuricauda sp.]MAU13926.1 hypothetical protein [Allomuricauda sp.]